MALQKYRGPFGGEFLESIRMARKEEGYYPKAAVEAHRSEELKALEEKLGRAHSIERPFLRNKLQEIYAERFVLSKVANYHPTAIRKLVSILRAVGKGNIRLKTDLKKKNRKPRLQFIFPHANSNTVVLMRFDKSSHPSFEVYDPKLGEVFRLLLHSSGVTHSGLFPERRRSYKFNLNTNAKNAYLRIASVAGMGQKEVAWVRALERADEAGR